MVTKTTSNVIDNYIDSTVRLVRSLVIKSDVSIDRCNKAIVDKYGVDAVDMEQPHTWKYYMNIAGQYHFTDPMMRVISLDTKTEIDFTVPNMKIHTATAEAYKYGSRFYFSLLRQYPDKEQLILAITNPAILDVAIKAKDGDVLAYYRDLVEPQETTLIYDIQSYARNYLARYTVIGFNKVWRNYPVLNLSNLYGSLVAQIMNLRLLAAKTDRTHSFHIRQYLASHSRLDRFIPYMTLKQMLYLYHNIDYIEKFAGHTSTFEELIQWILDDRRIPLSSFTVRQLQEHDGKLYPELRARRSPLGTLTNTVESEYIPIENLYKKEMDTQRGNMSYFDYHSKTITRTLATDDTSVIQTKDLESAMVDYTDAVPDSLPEVLLRQWAFMSASGFYNVLVNFNHNITGERISIMANEALIYYSYVMMKIMGHEPQQLPEFLNVKYRLHPRPDVNLLYRDLIPYRFPELKDIADELVTAQPIIQECFSVTAFFDLSFKIYEECMKHWFMKANIGDPLKRGVVAKMCMRLFGIKSLVLDTSNMSMKEWLASKSLPEYNGSYEDGLALCRIIFQQATGHTVDETKTLRSIQRAMVEMFGQLSSYSVQVMREINDSAIIPLSWAAIRVGMEGQDTEDIVKIESSVRVLDAVEETHHLTYVQDDGDHVSAVVQQVQQDVRVNDSTYVKLESEVSMMGYVVEHFVNIPATRVSDDSIDTDNQNNLFQPMQYYEALSNEELSEIAAFLNSRN